jgi:hypothetical protein
MLKSLDESAFPLNKDANGLSVGAIIGVVASDVALGATVVFVSGCC